MYQSESWQSWSKSASHENISEYENDPENYEVIEPDKEFMHMQHSNIKEPSEYADKRYFRPDMEIQSTEAQMIAATSQVHINRRTKINSPRPKDSHSVKDYKHSNMDSRVPPRFPSQINPKNHSSRKNYESESKMRDLFVDSIQGPPVDRNLKPEKLRQSKVNTQSSNGRSMPKCSDTNEKIANIQSNTVPGKISVEEEDADTMMAIKEVIDVHQPKDFIKQKPELHDPTHISHTANFRKKQTCGDNASQTNPESRNEEGSQANTTDLKMKWCAVKEDLESQLITQRTRKKSAPFNEMEVAERYLSVSPNRTISDNDIDGAKGTENKIDLNENLGSSLIHHVKMKMSHEIPENISKKAKVPLPEQKKDSGRSRRKHVTAFTTHKVSEYILMKSEEHVEQKEDSSAQTTTATRKSSKCIPNKHEEQEEHKESSGTCAQEVSTATATQLISEPKPFYKQEEQQCYENVINLLQDILIKQERIHPQDEHVTFLMSLAPYIKHVPESQQLLMRVRVMNTILSFIPSLSDSHHSATTTMSASIEDHEEQKTSKTL
ncbi:cytokine-dependent hematopoietic cell linker isoform X1 [Pyxicephalus adspersus]|uniref:cytokine-dependent hematopoietic cell linker isoform X1 n=1 Tax=Pyxicephalus adspersus TaxID=30357 RepID=UPI003B5AA33B